MHNDRFRGGRGGAQDGNAVDFDGTGSSRREAGSSRTAIARPLAWACIAAIAVLSLVPGPMRPHTFLPGWGEHFIAYAGTGCFLALGFPGWRHRMFAWISLALAGGVVEILQNFVPGRSPSPLDALASMSGLTLGMFFGAVLTAVWSRASRRALKTATGL